MLRLIFALAKNLIVLALYPLFALRRRRAAPPGAWVRVDVEGALVELARRAPFWDRRPRPFALQSLRRLLELVSADARVAGIVVVIDGLRAGSATATGLRDLLLRAKSTGKRVAVYLPNGSGTVETYVASAADLVLLGPGTDVAALGFAVQSPYLRGALDKLGIEPEVFARGAYKTAGEPLLLRKMSEPQKEQLEALLDSSFELVISALSSGRSVERARAEQWVHGGPWSALSAVQQGIADGISYPDELGKKLEPRSKDGARCVPSTRYARRRQIPWSRLFRGRRIAFIEVHGAIVSEHVGPMPVAAEDDVTDAIGRALDDSSVKGAILHVDSRGGSALASDRMLHAVKRLAEKKPVVACLGDAAASGGYMVAVGAHAIVAQPTTVTGSIGVVAARFVIGPLLERLGIGVEVVKRGARADMASATRHLTSDEHEVLERQLAEVYASFLQAVADGRKKDVSEIEPLAGGRVWSGRDAHARGLVDRLGGLDTALEELHARIGPESARMELAFVSARRARPPGLPLPGWLGSVFAALGGVGAAELVTLATGAARERAWFWGPAAEIEGHFGSPGSSGHPLARRSSKPY